MFAYTPEVISIDIAQYTILLCCRFSWIYRYFLDMLNGKSWKKFFVNTFTDLYRAKWNLIHHVACRNPKSLLGTKFRIRSWDHQVKACAEPPTLWKLVKNQTSSCFLFYFTNLKSWVRTWLLILLSVCIIPVISQIIGCYQQHPEINQLAPTFARCRARCKRWLWSTSTFRKKSWGAVLKNGSRIWPKNTGDFAGAKTSFG